MLRIYGRQKMPEKNKLAIVTGSSKGIGAGIVNSFLQSGEWHVLGIARSSLNNTNEKYSELLLDLFQSESVKAVKNRISELKSSLKIEEICFVHNFGFTHNSSILDLSEEVWDTTFAANVRIPFLLTREISPLMPDGSSHLFIGSTLSEIAVPDSAAYIASKHALAGLMKAVSVEFAAKGIRTNLICPGFTESDMAKKVIEHSAQKNRVSAEENWKAMENMSPLKRLLKPDEIGKFVLYLAENPSISAQVLHINGGFGLLCP